MLTFSGAAYERGAQHGEARHAAIAQRVEHSVLAAVSEASGSLDELAAPWWHAIAGAAPRLADELRGIADGAERPRSEILLLNAFEAFDLARQVELGGCTSVAIPRPDGAIVGQNWDANPSLAATIEVHRHRTHEGHDLVLLASPGGLGWIGMNAAGVAVVTNDLLTYATAAGVPSQVARRLMLESAGVPDAAAALRALPAVGGRTYLIGDATGRVAVAELAAELPSPWIGTSEVPVAHTNHALEPEVAGHESDELLRTTYPTTHHRLARVIRLLDERPPRTADDVRGVLADHDGLPGSVCRHESPIEPTVTAASVIFDCGRKLAHIAIGNPCDTPYVTVSLEETGTPP